MAKVFVDTNYLIGLTSKMHEIDSEDIHAHKAFISTLSCHILFYVDKINVPNEKTNSFIKDFNWTPLTQIILKKALEGPTSDLEDNIQLHSAAEAECEYFLTSDKKLLSLKFFGKTKILKTMV